MTELFADRADEKRKEFAGGVDILCFKDMPFILLDRDDRVRRMADRLFSRYDITPRVLLETRNIQTAFALAMEGMGLTIYPEMFLSSQSLLPSAQAARDAVDCFPLDADLAQTIVVAYHPEKYLSNAARDFIEEAQELLRA
jgi:DNA-binding transcriptional LysR family regulator